MRRSFWFSNLAVLLALAVPLRMAEAHTRLVRAVPAVGSDVAIVPREVVLTFSEDVSIALCRIRLLDAKEQNVALDSVRASPGDARTVTAKILGQLPPGRYTVKWQAAGADGHPVRGEYSFVLRLAPAGK